MGVRYILYGFCVNNGHRKSLHSEWESEEMAWSKLAIARLQEKDLHIVLVKQEIRPNPNYQPGKMRDITLTEILARIGTGKAWFE